MRKIPKKVLLVGLALLIILITAVAVILISRLVSDSKNPTTTSQIKLDKVKSGMVLKNGDPISGSYTPKEGATLYYIVSSADKKVLGSGNIMPGKDNRFSRNLTFDAKDNKGKAGQLDVYLQDNTGRRLDGSKFDVKFE